MVPTFLALVVIVAGAFASARRAIYAQIVLLLFGAGAAIQLPALGGSSILAGVLFLPFLLWRAAAERDRSRSPLQVSPASGWLMALASWGVVSAIYLPQLLEGATTLLTLDRNMAVPEIALFPLRPVSGNITQTVYLLGAVAAFICLRSLLVQPRNMRYFQSALLLLTLLNIVAAGLNVAEFYLKLPSLLSYVRNAGYTIFNAYEEAGLVRIQGTFAETSAFSGFTLPLFAFSSSLWLRRCRSHYSGAVAGGSLLLLLLSTSGTAYVGLAAYLGLFALGLLRHAAASGRLPRAVSLTLLVGFVLVILGSGLMLETEASQRILRFFDQTVFSKMESGSGLERSSWNRQAWLNFLETYGLGTGLGSSRASSFPLVLLSNLGVIGALLFGGFLYCVLSTRSANDDYGVTAEAARRAAVAALIVASVSATVFDLGLIFYAYCAAASLQGPVNRERVALRVSHW